MLYGHCTLIHTSRTADPAPPQITSLPGSLLLYDNGTLASALPALANLAGVARTLMVYGKAGLDNAGLKDLSGLANIKVGAAVWLAVACGLQEEAAGRVGCDVAGAEEGHHRNVSCWCLAWAAHSA